MYDVDPTMPGCDTAEVYALNDVTDDGVLTYTGTFKVRLWDIPTEDVALYVDQVVRKDEHVVQTATDRVYAPKIDEGSVTMTISVSYILSYDGNGNTAGTAPEDQKVAVADKDKVSVSGKGDLAKKGYAFAGWVPADAEHKPADVPATGAAPEGMIAVDSATNDIPADATISLNDSTTLYAVWGEDKNDNGIPDFMEETYDVYLDNNGGTTQADPRIFNRLSEGARANLAAVTPPKKQAVDGVDYLFVGWVPKDRPAILKAGDKTDGLAIFTDSYTVAAKDSDKAPVSTEAGSVTLYALWAEDANGNGQPDYQEKAYTLSFDANTGDADSLPADLSGLLEGGIVTLQSGATKAANGSIGYMFLGWSKTAEPVLKLGGAKPAGIMALGAKYAVADDDAVNGTITLHAVWSENNTDTTDPSIPDVDEKAVTLGYANDQTDPAISGTMPETKTYAAGKAVTTASGDALVWDKHVIAGWLPNEAYTTIIPVTAGAADVPKGMIQAGDSYTMPESDAILHAVWADDSNGNGTPDYQEDQYAAQFMANGGQPAYRTVSGLVAGNRVQADTAQPNRAGFVLVGYDFEVIADITVAGSIPQMAVPFTDGADFYTLNPADAKTGKTVTLHAVWAVDSYGNGTPDCLEDKHTMVLHENGGTAADPSRFENLVAGNEVVLPSLTRADVGSVKYILVGWTKTADPANLTRDNKTPPALVVSPYQIQKDDSETVDLYAVWAEDANGNGTPDYEEARYTVSYLSNGVTLDQPAPADYMEKDLVSVAVTVIPNNGPQDKVFAGWVSGIDGTRYHNGFGSGADAVPATSPNSFAMPALDVTLTAKWSDDVNGNGIPDEDESDRYMVLLMVNGGSPIIPMKFMERLNGERVQIGTPTRDSKDGVDYLFQGWSAKQREALTKTDTLDGLAPLYRDAYTVDRAQAVDGIVWLYAVWAEDANGNGVPDYSENKYTVIYNGNKNTAGVAPDAVKDLIEKDVLSVADGSAMTKEYDGKKFAFIGWQKGGAAPDDIESNDAADLPAGLLRPGDSLTVAPADFTEGNLTLYAVYGIDENGDGTPDVDEVKETLTYADEHGAEGTLPSGVEKVAGAPVALEKPSLTLAGYEFVGWSTEKGLELFGYNAVLPTEGFYAFNSKDNTFIPNSLAMPKGGATLYAVWARPQSDLDGLVIKIDTADSSTMGDDGTGRVDAGRFILRSVAEGSSMEIPYKVYEPDGVTEHETKDYSLDWVLELAGGFEGKEDLFGPIAGDLLSISADTLTGTVTAKKSVVYRLTVSLTHKDGSPVTGEHATDYCYVVVPGDVDQSGAISGADATVVSTILSGRRDMPVAGSSDFLFELADLDVSGNISGADYTQITLMLSGKIGTN